MPQIDVEDLRCDGLAEPVDGIETANKVGEPVVDPGSLGMKEGARGCVRAEAEKIELRSETAVVSGLGLALRPFVLLELPG